MTSFACDLCKHPPFKAPTALGRHKQAAHGVLGSSKSSIAYRMSKTSNKAKEKKNARLAAKSTHHEVYASREDTPTQSLARAQKAQILVQNQGNRSIPEGALAVALGRFQEFCIGFSHEYDLPPKLFASRLTQLIVTAQKVR